MVPWEGVLSHRPRMVWFPQAGIVLCCRRSPFLEYHLPDVWLRALERGLEDTWRIIHT